MSDASYFSVIPEGKRIWAISSVEGDAVRLRYLHRKISAEFQAGDAVVYLGNILGRGPDSVKALDEVLLFRRALVSIPGVSQFDIVYLRGQQEEIFHKLMKLQYAPHPREVLDWMLAFGLDNVLESYGANVKELKRIIPQGVVAISKWLAQLRQIQKSHDGHIEFMDCLKHAAYTADEKMLFVHFGLNHDAGLSAQGDAFWWGAKPPFVRPHPFHQFLQVVRTLSSAKNTGVISEKYYTTLVSGAGYDAPIYAVLFDENHEKKLVFNC